MTKADLIDAVDWLKTTVEKWDRAEPHVVVIYDPETNNLSTVGPYVNAEAAEATILALQVDLNSAENNDGVPVAIFIAHLSSPKEG